MTDKSNSTIGNYSYNMVAAIWEAISDIAIMAIIARYLEIGLFGDYAFVMAFVASFRVLCGISLPVIITREIAIKKEKASRLLTAGLFIQGITSLFTLALVSLIINIIHSNTMVIQATYLAILGIALDFLGDLFLSVAKGYERMEYVAYRIIISQSVFLILLFFLIQRTKNGFISLFFLFMIARFSGLLYAAYIVMYKFVRPAPTIDMKLCKYLFLEAYPIALRRFIRRVGFRIDTILLNFLRGNIEVGLFHGAYKIMQGTMLLGESLVVSVFPVLSRHYVKAKDSLDILYERSFRFLAVSGTFLALILFTFSRKFVLLILGGKYIESASVLKIFSVVIVFMFLIKLAERMLIVGNRQGIVLFIAAIGLSTNVLLDLILIPKMGMIGACLATAAAEIFLFILGVYYTDKFISKAPVHVCILKVLLVYSITCIFISFSKYYFNRYVVFLGGPILYIVGIFTLKLISLDELREIKEVFLKKCNLQTGDM